MDLGDILYSFLPASPPSPSNNVQLIRCGTNCTLYIVHFGTIGWPNGTPYTKGKDVMGTAFCGRCYASAGKRMLPYVAPILAKFFQKSALSSQYVRTFCFA